jgi:hypothetical protein
MQQREVTGWAGWAIFAAFIMMLVGVFDIIAGLVAIFDDDYLIVQQGRDDNLYIIKDVTAWGWVVLIIGVIILLAGLAVLRGAVWARTIGVIMAFLQACAHLATIDSHPWWSLIVIVLDVLVIYGLVVHGGELREEY